MANVATPVRQQLFFFDDDSDNSDNELPPVPWLRNNRVEWEPIPAEAFEVILHFY